MLRRFDARLEEVSHMKTGDESHIQNPDKPEEDGANKLEKQNTMENSPSKIRNMISAFESSLNQVYCF